jgi:hypothetical protein
VKRLRVCSFCAAAALLLSQGCGYIGPVQPPSLHIPVAVTDLSVSEIGDSLHLQFTLPQRTTDAAGIGKFHGVELRAGPDVTPFDFSTWLEGTKPVAISAAEVNSAANESQPLKTTLPVSEWAGKEIAVAVRTAQKDAHYSQWSNVVRLRVVEPLSAPVLSPASDPNGVKLTIESFPKHGKVRIFRRGPNDAQPVEAGIADSPEYVDRGAEYGTPYTYTAVAFDDNERANAVSKASEAVPFTSIDKFPPSVPVNVTALAGPGSIELSWDRSPEADTHGYHVFRSVNDGPFERVGDLVTLPAFSDKDVQKGKKYSYQVSAVDVRNNESARSTPVQVSF